MRGLVAAAGVLLVVAGCGSTKTVTVTTTQTVIGTVTAPRATARVYFLREGKVAPVARQVAAPDPSSLMRELQRGPSAREAALGFARGSGRARTAEVVYTLSQLQPGRPVEVGGKRFTRADFEDLTPTILVESPLPFQPVSAPLRVTGTANTFEATFEYELLDPAGKVLSRDFVTATSGSGTRGTFDFRIPFEAPGGLGQLVVFERSAADGSRIHQVEIPLSLAR